MNENIDVNSELYFNEKLNYWLNHLTPSDILKVLKTCFGIKLNTQFNPIICPWDSVDSGFSEYGRFDQKIDYGKELCIILELKIGTEATVGQLEKYLSYIKVKGYKEGYLVLLSRNELASEKLGYDRILAQHSNLLFVTWKQFESKLSELFNTKSLESTKSNTEDFLYLLSFLTDIRKRSERLILQPPPPKLDVINFMKAQIPAPESKKQGYFLVWKSRIEFWDELLARMVEHSHTNSFCAFRFDFYEYIMRWAFHEKNVYLDIYEDKNYEYLYNYFITKIYPAKGSLQSAKYSELYYRFLLIRKDEVLETSRHYVFFRKCGKLWYIYIVEKHLSKSDVPYLRLSDLKFE